MRPRERFVQNGPHRFGDAELIALLLGTGTAEHSTLQIGAALLTRFHDLSGIARASVHELESTPGVGPARAIRIKAALEVGRRSLRVPQRPSGLVLSPEDAFSYLGPPLLRLDDEELHALYLDRRRQVLGHRQLTRGSDGYTVVDPRQVFREAVGLAASGVVLAHNHPSGDPTPSPQDREVTRRVSEAGRVLGIRLLDHLVVGGATYVSLAEEGLLNDWSGSTGPTWTRERG